MPHPSTTDTQRSTPPQTQAIQTVAFVSLGCPKNLVDSEKMLGLLAEDGLIPIADETQADAIVINTCGFLEASKIESVQEIQRAAALKETGQCKRVVVAGCLVQRHRAKLLEWCPQIDAMIGVFDRDRIVQAVLGNRPNPKDLAVKLPVYSSIASSATLAKQQRNINAPGYFESDSARLRLTPRHYAYLRMSEGCNQNCAFCTIPSIRGKMRSKPIGAIVPELKELLLDGAYEINLIGQDTTSYGSDIDYAPGLVGLLETLDKTVQEMAGQQAGSAARAGTSASENTTPGGGGTSGVGGWIRLMYAYPSCFTDAMIDAIASLPNIVKYIDMPLQHIHDDVLNAMRRKTSRQCIETLLTKLRDRIPGIAIRTTLISGFPGETDQQHNELVQFIKDFKFEALGVFPYSPEPGTPAGTLHQQGSGIAQDVIDARIEQLMLAQQEVAFKRNSQSAQSQQTFDVLIDQATETKSKATPSTPGVGQGGHRHTGRTYQQAPQVDSVTYVQSRSPLSPGELVRCQIVDSDGYDLIAKPLSDLTSDVALPIL